MFDICIIGAGASGMSAALTALWNNPRLKIIILEKKEKPGKKIIVSGNGKCNISNINCSNYQVTVDFFKKIGVVIRTDESGRMYPYNEDSKTVEAALAQKAVKLGASIETNFAVDKITPKDVFRIHGTRGDIQAKKVLIACGGKAAPKLGTTGDGHNLAKQCSHTVTRLVPVLTAVDVAQNTASLAGIRSKSEVSLFYHKKKIFCEEGEIQFTKSGVSGICIFNLSRFLIIPEGKNLQNGFEDYEIGINFIPDLGQDLLSEEELESVVRKPLAEYIRKLAGGNIESENRLLRNFLLKPEGVKGWDFAQVTKGGIPLKEIDMDTMESKIVKNLFFAGEVIDYDGPCGGYNLQNAWETGIKAGIAMSRADR